METILMPSGLLLALGMFLGLILGIADKYLKVEMDPRLETLITMLPGFNCGACGSPGCAGLADEIMEGTNKLKACPPLKPDAEAAIREYLSTAADADGNVIDVSKI